MAPQAFSSAMQDSYNFLHNLIKLSPCSRRKQMPAPPTSTLPSKKARAFETNYNSDDTSSTEPGDSSNNEFSDKTYLTDASSSPMRAPPGLSAPPGLEGLNQQTCFNVAAPCFVPATMPQSSLNAKAASFCPGFDPAAAQNSQQLRRSIGMLKGALEEWEASLPDPSIPAAPQHTPLGHGETDSLLALQQALTNLTPKDTAALRSFLDCKVASHNASSMSGPVQQPRQPAATQKWGNPRSAPQSQPRPFTPFSGSRPPWDQARPTRAAQNMAPKAPAVADDSEESLRTHLRDLALLDNAKVLMLRKINRLGINSHEPLKEHFSQFGNVERVMVAPTRSKPQFGQSKARVRAAPLGFVVMSSAEGAKAALEIGEEHIVQGECIGVFSFQSHTIEDSQ